MIIISNIKFSVLLSTHILFEFISTLNRRHREKFIFIRERKFLKNHSSWFEAQPWNFHPRQIEFYFSTLWRFSNLVAFLMFSPWTSSCPIVYKAVIWTSGLDFYTSTKCSSDKSCLFFFSTKAFVLNYATKGKVLCGASCEICAKRHLGNIKTKE